MASLIKDGFPSPLITVAFPQTPLLLSGEPAGFLMGPSLSARKRSSEAPIGLWTRIQRKKIKDRARNFLKMAI